MTTPTQMPESLKVVAWGTTRTLDGKQILDEMCVSTNPAYVKVHNHHAWEPLVKKSDFEAALQSALKDRDAEIERLKKDAGRYRWLREQEWFNGELCVLREPKRVLTRGIGLGADCPSRDRLDAAIDSMKGDANADQA